MNYVPLLVEVAKAFRVEYDDLKKKRKGRDASCAIDRPRAAVAFMMRANMATLREIQTQLNYTDHSSARYAYLRALALLEKDDAFLETMKKIPSFRLGMIPGAA